MSASLLRTLRQACALALLGLSLAPVGVSSGAASPDPGSCILKSVARCFREAATTDMRRAISSKFHYPFIYQGPTDCRGPGLKPGEPTYSADSYLADPAMRTLEARLHYGLRYSCTWGGTGRAVVIFMRNTLHWSVSVTITAVPPKT